MGWHAGSVVRLAIATALVQLAACSRDPVADPSDGTSGSSGVVDTLDTVDDTIDTCHLDPCCGDPCCLGECDTDTWDTDNDTDEPEPEPEPCDGVDCGAGTCVVDENDEPSCVCDDGHVDVGLTCLACIAVDDAHDIDIPVATIAIQPTLNGDPFPDTASQSAELVLVGNTGDRVELGDTTVPERTASVVPGRYRLVYRHVAGADLPQNSDATLAWIDVAEDAVIAVDVLSTPLSGNFYVDGSVAPDSTSENGRLTLRNGDDTIELGETRDGAYAIRIIPGQYDIEYGWLAGGEIVPANPHAQIGAIDVPAIELIEIDIDIPTVEVGGTITIAGEPPPESALENGLVSLVGAKEDDVIALGETRHGDFASRVVPGQYAVIYERMDGGELVPMNGRAALGSIDASDASWFEVDIPMLTIAGTFTLDGAVPPPAQGSDGEIVLTTAAGDLVSLGVLSSGSYEANVVAGDYDLQYRVQQGDDDVYPRNDVTTLAQVAIDGDETLDIDVPTVTLVGEVTIDGAAPPVMGDGGSIVLYDQSTAQTFMIAAPGASSFSVSVVPGTYDVMYAAAEVAVVAPMNSLARIGAITIDEDTAVAIDVPVRAPFGAITIAGADPDGSAPGELALEDVAIAEAQVFLAAVADGNYATRVTPGEYLVRYRATSDAAVPANENAALACLAIQ